MDAEHSLSTAVCSRARKPLLKASPLPIAWPSNSPWTRKALVASHVHIDHVGRIPYLLAAGFKGPILCSEPSVKLLPVVLEDVFKLGFSRNQKQVERYIKLIEQRSDNPPPGGNSREAPERRPLPQGSGGMAPGGGATQGNQVRYQ
jgi:metal-dependent hydrolase (beta-lactamase superfamily II)